MTDLAIKADINNAPLGTGDMLLVQRQGEPGASRTPANALPIPASTAQALSTLQTNAANDASTKADGARDAAISAAATDATSKANAAQAAAIAAAATDATTKANAARDSANQTALNTYIPLSQRGTNNGVATLDGTGKVPAIQLPSFVDDVLEFATLASFPATGETGKIYIAINGAIPANPTKQYRWSGSAYSEITSSPGSTDAVAEGATNRYFTEERVNATPITGLLFNVIASIANGETLRVMLGKIQAQLNNATNVVRGTPLTGIVTTVDGEIIETTTVLQAIGRLVARVTARLVRRLPDGTDLSFGSVANGQLLGREGNLIVGVDAINDVSYTLAERPPAAGNADATIRLKGVGNVRSVWQESNGSNWGMQNGHAVIWQEAFPDSKAVTTAPVVGTYTDLPDSYVIPGGILNENSQVRIRPRFAAGLGAGQTTPGNQVQVLINGQTVYESTAGNWFQQMGEIRFSNLGALNAQQLFGPGTTGTGLGNSNANTTAGSGSLRSYDTAADLTITFKIRQAGIAGTPDDGTASTFAAKLAGITVEVFDR